MATYWTDFAKDGDPNGPGLPRWPDFTDSKPLVMHFTDAPHVGSVPNLQNLEVLDAYFAWRRTPQGAAWAARGALQ
jgi:para-nitrobenzyl esterase